MERKTPNSKLKVTVAPPGDEKNTSSSVSSVYDAKTVLQLITNYNAVVKMIGSEIILDEYKKLGHDSLKHWIFILQQFAYPGLYRPVDEISQECDRTQVWDQDQKKYVSRTVKERGRYQPIEAIKKTSFSMLPTDGKMHLFNESGFNAGILAQLDACQLHGNSEESKTKTPHIYLTNASTKSRLHIRRKGKSKPPKNLKKKISLNELKAYLEGCRMQKIVPQWNELWIRSKRAAIRAVFSPKDKVSDRLNALNKKYLVKRWLRFDVPVLIITSEKGHFEYNIDQMVKDILSGFRRRRHKKENEQLAAAEFAEALIFDVSLENGELWKKLCRSAENYQGDLFDFPHCFFVYKHLSEHNINDAMSLLKNIELSPQDKSALFTWCAERFGTVPQELLPPYLLNNDSLLLLHIQGQFFRTVEFLLENYRIAYSEKTLGQALLYLTIYKQFFLVNKLLSKLPRLTESKEVLSDTSLKGLNYGQLQKMPEFSFDNEKDQPAILFEFFVRNSMFDKAIQLIKLNPNMEIEVAPLLHISVKYGCLELVKLLLNKNPNSIFDVNNEETALTLAARYNHKEIVEYFLSQDVVLPDSSLIGGLVRFGKNLFNLRTDFVYPSRVVDKTIHYLIKNNQLQLAKDILQKNKKIKHIGDFGNVRMCTGTISGNTSLHFALLAPQVDDDLIKFLCCDNNNLALANGENKTPLLLAAERNLISILNLFIKNPVYLSQYTLDQLSEVLEILITQNIEHAKLLLEATLPAVTIPKGPKVAQYLGKLVADEKCDIVWFKLLTQNNSFLASPIAPDGQTILSVAANKNQEVVDYFLQDQTILDQYKRQTYTAMIRSSFELESKESRAKQISCLGPVIIELLAKNNVDQAKKLLLLDPSVVCTINSEQMMPLIANDKELLALIMTQYYEPCGLLISAAMHGHFSLLVQLLEKYEPRFTKEEVIKVLEIILKKENLPLEVLPTILNCTAYCFSVADLQPVMLKFDKQLTTGPIILENKGEHKADSKTVHKQDEVTSNPALFFHLDLVTYKGLISKEALLQNFIVARIKESKSIEDVMTIISKFNFSPDFYKMVVEVSQRKILALLKTLDIHQVAIYIGDKNISDLMNRSTKPATFIEKFRMFVSKTPFEEMMAIYTNKQAQYSKDKSARL